MVFVIYFSPCCIALITVPSFGTENVPFIWNGECDYNEFSPISSNLGSSSSQMIPFPSVEEGELGATLKPKLQRRDTDLVRTESVEPTKAAYSPAMKGPRQLRDLDTNTVSSCSSQKPPPAAKRNLNPWLVLSNRTHHSALKCTIQPQPEQLP